MSVQFDGTDARISTTDTVGAPTALPITLACIARFDAINRWHGLLQIATNNVARGLEWEINNTNHLHLSDNNGVVASFASAGSVAANVWYFLGTAITSAASNNVRHFCYNLETNAIVFNETATRNPWTYTGPNSGEDYTIGSWTNTGASFSDFMDGTMAWLAIYNRDCNTTEAMQVLATLGPYALGAPVALWDLLDSVEGATATVARERINGNTGTLTNVNFDANGGWRPMSLPGPWWSNTRLTILRPQVTSGGTTTQLSLDSAVTPATALVKGVNKTVSSAVVPVSSVVKIAYKVITSSVTPSSIIIKTVSKAMESSVTPVSSVIKTVNKALSSSIDPVSSIVKLVGRVLNSSAITSTALVKSIVKGGFSSSVVPVSSIVKIVSKVLSSSITPTSSVLTSTVKVLVLSSVVVPVSGLVKVVNKGLSSSVIPVTGIVKVCSKVLDSAVIPATLVVKLVYKTLTSSVTPTTSVITSTIKVLVLNSVVVPVSTLTKTVVIALSSVATPTTTIIKVVSKVLASSVTPTTTFVKTYLRYIVLDSFVTPVSSIVTQYIPGSGLPSLNSILPTFRRRRRQ